MIKQATQANTSSTSSNSAPRHTSLAQRSIFACTDWQPCQPVSMIICERTGLSIQYIDDLGEAWMSSYAVHPRFLPAAFAALQNTLRDRQQARRLDNRLIAGAILYLLTKPRIHAFPILHHVSTLELAVINSGLAKLDNGTCLALYNIVRDTDWRERTICVASFADNGLPLEEYANEVAKHIEENKPAIQEKIAEQHYAKAIEREHVTKIVQAETAERSIAVIAQDKVLTNLHRWLTPWKDIANTYEAMIADAQGKHTQPSEINAWQYKADTALQCREVFVANPQYLSLKGIKDLSRTYGVTMQSIVDTCKQCQAIAQKAMLWTSQDQQARFNRALALLQTELASRDAEDEDCLD
jgi:hypothetical protein